MSSSMAKTTGYVGKTDLFKVDPREIHTQPGFNPRKHFNLDDLKDSIRENGFFLDKPLLLSRNGLDLVLVDGERRLRAVLALIDEGVPILAVPAVLEVSKNEVDLLARALAANSGSEPLEPLEEAGAFKKLLGYGWEPKQIAGRVGRSLSHVYARLKLLEATSEVIEALEAGEITTTEAAQVVAKADRGMGTQQEALEKTKRERKERTPGFSKIAKGAQENAAFLRGLLDEQGVAWVVAQLLEYADKEEILDAIHEAAQEAV